VKVVLFCGGLGLRIRDANDSIPKPMIPIGYRPILWHVMKYYAFFGHTEFILCLGYKADVIKDYFLNYDECISNDFQLSTSARNVRLLATDTDDWKITFVDTGFKSNIGQRLKAVEKYIGGDEMFLANYSDGLTDFPLPKLIQGLERTKRTAAFLSVKPNLSYHFVSSNEDGLVTRISDVAQSGIRINGGFYVFRRDIFKYIRDNEELVVEPFQRLIQKKELMAHKYDGFFAAMDTFKDKQYLEDLYAGGTTPWEVWKNAAPDTGSVRREARAHVRASASTATLSRARSSRIRNHG
jgi:glucose-1-phosphate cytidylyltransferase